jgi:hypothetical protein
MMMVLKYAMESKSYCIQAKNYLPTRMLASAVILDIMIYTVVRMHASKHQEQLLVKERLPQYSNALKCKTYPPYLLTNAR